MSMHPPAGYAARRWWTAIGTIVLVALIATGTLTGLSDYARATTSGGASTPGWRPSSTASCAGCIHKEK